MVPKRIFERETTISLTYDPETRTPQLETATEQPLWNPATPQSEQRHLIPPASFFLLVPRTMRELSQGFTFAVVWLRDTSGTTGTTETTGTLERLELATA